MESKITVGADWMGEPMFQHTAGMYRVTFAMRDHGLSVYVEELHARNGERRPFAISTAVKTEHVGALLRFLRDGVAAMEQRFAIVSEIVDSVGNTNITRSTVSMSEVVRHYEEMWCDQDVKDIRPKLQSMRVGDAFALGRTNRRETIVCIADSAIQP